jgi:serine/threonine-protein kinase RsbW
MTDNERVVLTVPARSEYARTVRLTAAELASRAGMNIDDVDDVKLAVEEAFVFAGEHVTDGELTFTFEVAPLSISLVLGPLPETCATEAGSDASERYARFILESICDEFALEVRDGACYVRLVKRAA